MRRAPSYSASLTVLIVGGVLVAGGSLLCCLGLSKGYSAAAKLAVVTDAVTEHQLTATRTLTGLGIFVFFVGLLVGAFGLAALMSNYRDD